jgi:hypothetical protein
MAKKLGCKLEKVKTMSITAGGGHKLEAPFICKGFTWTMHNREFTIDVIVLPLVCCDLILGVQWLQSLGPILWDFDKLQMEFTIDGRKTLLRGAKTTAVKLISNEALNQAVDNGAELCFLQLDHMSPQFIIPPCTMHHQGNPIPSVLPEIQSLLDHYAAIFKEPTNLPPLRMGFGHKIPLKENSVPINLRPYRYSIVQKNIVDKLVNTV